MDRTTLIDLSHAVEDGMIMYGKAVLVHTGMGSFPVCPFGLVP